MKTYKLIIFFFLTIFIVGCEEQAELYDFEEYKFVSFIDKEYVLNENYSEDEILEGNDPRFPIYLQYDGSVLEEDFTTQYINQLDVHAFFLFQSDFQTDVI